jgi:hypothetical protein
LKRYSDWEVGVDDDCWWLINELYRCWTLWWCEFFCWKLIINYC